MQRLEQISRSSASWAVKLADISRKWLSAHFLGKQLPEKVLRFYNEYKAILDDPNVIVVSTDEMHTPKLVQGRFLRKRHIGYGGWKQRSFIASIGSDGSIYHEIVQGSMKRNRFAEYIENLPHPRGSVILLDNCTIHKKWEDVFERKGYYPLFLSPYSPEFQPIEFAFSKIKRRFRSLYPWQDDKVNEALEESTNCVSSYDTKQFFKHS